MTFYACERHHSISRAPWYRLRAKTLLGAKREATSLLGYGFLGHQILLVRCDQDQGPNDGCPVSLKTIGESRWRI